MRKQNRRGKKIQVMKKKKEKERQGIIEEKLKIENSNSVYTREAGKLLHKNKY